MATMRDIKRRKSSIESTEQITKAMKLVATVKLQKSRTKAENSRLYFNLMYQTIQEMLKKSTGIRHRYLKSGDSKKKAVIVVSSNRGLAGGYNSNIIRLVTESGIPKEDALIFAIGRKGRDGLARKGYEIKADYSDVIDEPLYSDAQQISKELLAMFEKNEIGEIYMAYTAFKNTVSQIQTVLKLLPVDLAAAGAKGEVEEEKPVTVLSKTVPLADPYILVHDSLYYIYGTNVGTGFDVYYSKDLEYWERASALSLSHENSYRESMFWAPEVYYVEKDKKFYMFYSTEEHICVATADSPLGPFKQDEHKPIREEKSIDTSVFFDEDGKAYLYFVRFNDGNVIWCAELKENLKEIKEETLTQCFKEIGRAHV